MITVTQARENDRTTFCRQFTFNKNGYSNRELDGAVVSGMPVVGLLLSKIPDETLINIPENDSPVLFYKAKSDYETELNESGRSLLVRKDCYDTRPWHSSYSNAYATSDIDKWMNTTYKTLFPQSVQDMIGSTKFRYTPGNGNNAVETLDRSIFALSLAELGASYSNTNVEGSAIPIAGSLKIAYLNGVAITQWTRTPLLRDTTSATLLTIKGIASADFSTGRFGSRPAFTLPDSAMVDPIPNLDGSYNLIY